MEGFSVQIRKTAGIRGKAEGELVGVERLNFAVVLLVELVCLICGFVTGWIFGLLAMIPAVGVVFAVLKKVVGIALWLTAAFYIIYAAAHAARCRAKDVPFFGYIRFIR